MKKYNNLNQSDQIFYPENEEEINEFLNKLKEFGKLTIKNYGLFSSSILNKNINMENTLTKWIKEKINKPSFQSELIFKMSENGTKSNDFHKYCDNKGPTLILIKTKNNYIFGGFTPLNWNEEGGGIKDESNQTFIFSLNLMKKYDLKNRDKQAIENSKEGPNFGNIDFKLFENMEKGQTYADGSSNFLSNNNLELTGEQGSKQYFETDEFEVYKLIY